VTQQGCHGGAQHEGQLDQLMRQEVAVVVVQAGQLRHLHQPGACQMNQEEKREQKKRNRGENREQEEQKVRQGAVKTEAAVVAVQAEQLCSVSCLVEEEKAEDEEAEDEETDGEDG